MTKILLTLIIAGVIALSSIGLMNLESPVRIPKPQPEPEMIVVIDQEAVDEIFEKALDNIVIEEIKETPTREYPLDMLILFDAIAKKESNYNDKAVGPEGELGRFQITKDYWIEGCERLGVICDYKTNVTNPELCKQVMLGYWERYGATTDEVRAKMHRKGPNGIQTQTAQEYWEDIQKIMKERWENNQKENKEVIE